jgi:hypothetical protein
MNQPANKFQAARARATYGRDEGQANFINTIAASLNVIASQDVARLPEDIFSKVFLPLLAGDEELPHKVTVADWISIAGTPYKSVDVFEPGTDKVLFRVPPLFDYQGVNPVRDPADRRQTPIQDVVKLADQYSHLHPMAGVNYLRNVLGQRASIMNTSDKLHKHAVVWNEILTRYGRPPLFAAEQAAAAAPAQATGPASTQGDEPEYEDF